VGFLASIGADRVVVERYPKASWIGLSQSVFWMSLAAGTVIGPYRVMERIGRGGMATVYRGYHSGLDRYVAIKVLPELLADDVAHRERFQQEARSISRLKHPNIVEVFDFGQEGDLTFIVMELVDGGALESRLGAPMSLQQVVELLEPLAEALDYAHSSGVLHRDIKPSNILLHTSGIPVLADFGLAKIVGALRLTASGTVMGTPEYMSPEQAADEQLSPASDQYSLGVVAYQMLTGRVPFSANTPAAVLLSHMTRPMPPTHELKGELSAHLEEVLRRALAKQPEERYPNATAFVTALKPAAWPTRTESAPAILLPRNKLFLKPRRDPVVLVVDDASANRELIEACLADVDCQVRIAQDGPHALEAIDSAVPDLVLLDVQMPGMDGYEVCKCIKANPRCKLVPVVMITGLHRTEDRVRALEAGADDFMSKPVDRLELVARVSSALRLKRVYDSLDSAEQVIFSLAATVEAKDPYTEAHTRRVAESARSIGVRLGARADDLEALYRGGLIHDIGKVGVPDSILLKPGPLDQEETRLMQSHTLIGERIVTPLHSGQDLLPIIRHHHEHFDGRGYPDGLKGNDIPLMARIVAVCDAFDAMLNDRPYRPRRSFDEATETLIRGAGKQWDPDVVDQFVGQMRCGSDRGVA
jgi:putative two-component system response regulator